MRCGLCAVVGLVIVVAASAQSARPRFEIASVKKQAGPLPATEPTTGPRFHLRNWNLARLVQYAYRLHDFELIGGPDWARKDLFEIVARPANQSEDQSRLMMQSLLEERFKLLLHGETRQMRFYSLVLADKSGRLGPDLRKCDNPKAPQARIPFKRTIGALLVGAECQSLAQIVDASASAMQAPVVDRTGLTGLWNYVLLYPPQGIDVPAQRELPPFDIGLRERLGLTLEPQRGPMKVMVIHSVQQPTPD